MYGRHPKHPPPSRPPPPLPRREGGGAGREWGLALTKRERSWTANSPRLNLPLGQVAQDVVFHNRHRIRSGHPPPNSKNSDHNRGIVPPQTLHRTQCRALPRFLARYLILSRSLRPRETWKWKMPPLEVVFPRQAGPRRWVAPVILGGLPPTHECTTHNNLSSHNSPSIIPKCPP